MILLSFPLALPHHDQVHDFIPQPDAPFQRAPARLATDVELLLEGTHSELYLQQVAARTRHAAETKALHVLDEALEGGGQGGGQGRVQGKDAEISAGYTASTERAARAAAASLIDSAMVRCDPPHPPYPCMHGAL